MKSLTIEIHGTGTHNRGAELMAIAISDRMRERFPGVRLVVPSRFGSQADREKYGFLVTWEFYGRLGLVKTWMAKLLWGWRTDVVDPASVDVVLDASGFAFSDQWGVDRPRKVLRMMERPHRRKQPLLLLPQALGPFEKADVAHWSKGLFQRASLICARDMQSHASVKALGLFEHLRLYPDFTVAVSPSLPGSLSLPEKFSAIVPNIRMLDKTGSGEKYLDFLRYAVKSLSEKGMNPVFVLHDAEEDREVLNLLGADFAGIQVLTHDDPRVLKAILGKAYLVIGSRFHALVSALSQGVPAIAAGWAHKYPELLNDFGCPSLLVSDLADKRGFDVVMSDLMSVSARNDLSLKISERAAYLKQRTNDMWSEVEDCIRKSRQS